MMISYDLENSKFLVLRSWQKEIRSINLDRYLLWSERHIDLPKKIIKINNYKKF